jgi:hypothetical protein
MIYKSSTWERTNKQFTGPLCPPTMTMIIEFCRTILQQEPNVKYDLRTSNTMVCLLLLLHLFPLIPALSTSSSSSVGSLATLSSSQCIDQLITKPSIKKESLFPGVSIGSSPSLHSYLVANPSYFLNNPSFSKQYGVDINCDTTTFISKLPVIYLANTHPEYGVLGLQLNSKTDKTMNDLFPALRSLRQRPIYHGGQTNRGSSFLMIHTIQGFPENRYVLC